MAEWRLPETHKYARSGSAGIGSVHLRSTPMPPFFATRSLSNRLGVRFDSRDCSRSSRTTLPGSTLMGAEKAESSTPQSSVVSSVVVVENQRVEIPTERSQTRYLVRIKDWIWKIWSADKSWWRPWGSSTCHIRT